MKWYAVSKEGNFLKDLANKIEGLGASTSNEEYGRIMSTMLEKEEQFEKIEEDLWQSNETKYKCLVFWGNAPHHGKVFGKGKRNILCFFSD